MICSHVQHIYLMFMRVTDVLVAKEKLCVLPRGGQQSAAAHKLSRKQQSRLPFSGIKRIWHGSQKGFVP